MLFIFMGQMAMGKSFAAETFSKASGIAFLEGDSVIPGRFKLLLSDGAVDDFVKGPLTNAIAEHLEKNHGNLIVSYAFYREQHRQHILDKFKDRTDVVFIHVETSLEIQNKNLEKRYLSYGWKAFAAIARRMAFEYPILPHETLNHANGGEADILQKICQMSFHKELANLVKESSEKYQKNALFAESKEPATETQKMLLDAKQFTKVEKQSFYKEHPYITAGVVLFGLAVAHQACAQTECIDSLKKKLF